MSKNIAISDKIYEKLKKEKKDKSFSEIIEEKLDSGGKIAEVTGSNILDPKTMKKVKEKVEKSSRGTVERIKDETA